MRRFAVISTLLVLSLACGSKGGGDEAKAAKPGGDQPAPGKPGQAPKKPAKVAPSRGDEHAVFSLIDNRLLAHLQRGGGLLVLPGSASFPKYTRFGKKPAWKLRQERDGKKVAVADRYASIDVPLGAGQAGEQRLLINMYNPVARRMTTKVNGKDMGTIELAAGWITAEVALKADALVGPGENTIQMITSAGAPTEIEWIQVGGTGPGDGPPRLYDAAAKSLVLPDGGGVAYYVMVPDKGLVTGDVDGDGCTVKVSARTQDGKPVEGTLEGVGSAVDLAALAGQVVRLELTGAGCREAKLAKAALVVPGKAPQVQRGEAPKYVVFWIMDSLRADRVKTFVAGARPDVPVLDDLAGSSAVFQQTYVQGNESRSSHAAIWSSLYAIRHQMITEKASLAAKWTTIDEVAKAAGMFASGVSGNGYIIGRRGFGTRWDAYRNHIHDGGGVRGEDILKYALASVDGKKDPWFLYLGTIDTHVSWRAKKPWIDKYDPGYTGRFASEASGTDVGKMASGALSITDREKQHIIAIYDSNVSYQDDLVGATMRKLGEWGIADQTLLIITADHGDEQWEVGRVGHGGSLRESLVHVPLLIRYPALLPAGRIPEGAETIDILPTIADALGVDPDPEWQGESLIPLAQGVGRGYPRLSVASQYETAHAARLGPWKLRIAGIGKPMVYHLGKEPDEKNDVADSEPFGRRFVSDPLWLLRAYNDEWRKSKWGNPANATAAFAADLGE